MSSISRILSVAAGALRAQQSAISTTSHNVANAATEGFSRQRTLMNPGDPLRLPEGNFGSGVQVAGVERMRDELLDGSFRSESSRTEAFQTHSQLLGRVEGMLAEPGDEGLSAALDRFLAAFSELATSPESTAARSSLRQRSDALTTRMNDLAAGLDRVRQEETTRLAQVIDRAQVIVDDLTNLNRRIVSAETGGNSAPDLRDQQDRALDELATLLPVEAIRNANGSVRVHLDGIGLVDGPDPKPIELASIDGVFRVRVGAAVLAPGAGEGRIGGILEFLNQDLPALSDGLDEMAAGLVDTVNEIHRTGTNPMGEEGVDFFHTRLDGNGGPLPATATGIRLSDAVLQSSQAIAAGSGTDPGQPENQYVAGSNDIALQIARLRDQALPELGTTLSDRYDGLVGELAGTLRRSMDSAEIHGILSEQADLRRTSVSGVSLDEEMANLIQFQAAYSAAARMVSTADEMLQTLLRI